MDRRETKIAGQRRGCGAAINPGEFKGNQRQSQVLGPLDEATFGRVHKDLGQPGFVKSSQDAVFLRGPVMGIARTVSDQVGDYTASHATG